ncbi:MAG: hypothetical protein EOO07_05280 [Chitinophagaceae bacterium]|nr:MAG: hypothetical protein EOO07_05280 [Chitinophagaceae bacterium]
MTLNKKNKTRKKSAGFDLMPIVIVVGVIGLLLTIYIGYRASISDRKLFSASLIALFGGLLFESIRVSGSWKTVAGIFTGTYLFSLLAFLPGKREQVYNFENHIELWPYFFIFIFALFFGIAYKDRVTAKLTEGITLLLSLSLVYWTIDYGFINYNNWFAYSLLTIAFLLTVFSIINALTNLHLSRTTRLTLSIWSTVIMFAFAVDNIFRVFDNPDIESTYLSDSLYIGLQFFLLGVSAVYVMQNYMLLAAFLPSKNGNYRRDLKENKKDHIDRFSDEQVFTGHSILCTIYAVTFYGLNYKYQVLPRHTMIWLVFLTFPLFLRLIDFVTYGRKNYR